MARDKKSSYPFCVGAFFPKFSVQFLYNLTRQLSLSANNTNPPFHPLAPYSFLPTVTLVREDIEQVDGIFFGFCARQSANQTVE